MEWAKLKQITDDQKIVLKTLAESVARPSVKFLEVGNWLGDSTLTLAEVAQANMGTLYCVDWWKGNIGTDLEAIASQEDIFSLFWQRVCQEGFEDIVVPIRSSSDAAAEILKDQAFDLVFIDGDHRYEQTLKDIRNYAAFIKPDGGILCGHDCEGYVSDFDEEFLINGKDKDCHETVHCGVVLAVAATFRNYSINHSIWSIISHPGERTWDSTDFNFPNLDNHRQTPPPLLGTSENYNVFRYGKQVYAVPKDMDGYDVTNKNQPQMPSVIIGNTLDTVEDLINDRIWVVKDSPTLLSAYRGFNLVQYKDKIYALHESIGPLDLTQTTELEIKEFKKTGKCFVKKTLEELKEKINSSIPILVEQNYRKFNVVFYRGKYIAVAQDLGKIKDWEQFDFKKYQEAFKCFVADSQSEVLRLVDQRALQILEEEVKEKKADFQKSLEEIKGRDSRIAALEKEIAEKGATPSPPDKKVKTSIQNN